MKLHLKNFRIYEDRTFDLGSSGQRMAQRNLDLYERMIKDN